MTDTSDISFGHFENAEQIAFWNGTGGARWVARRAQLDAVLAPVQEALFERAAIKPGERVLDIGCGCGATMIAAAEKVGPGGSVLGLDVSAAMLTCAHETAPADAPVTFVQGDAMVHHFKAASADLVISRLGMTYFADAVRAILNIRNALRSEGRVAFACWRELRDNPWALEPLQAAYDHVPKLPGLRPHAPDDFAFGASEWVEKVVTEAGLRRVRLERCDVTLDLAAGGGLDGAVLTSLAMGPACRAVTGQPAEAAEAASVAVGKALARYARGQGILVPASFWVVTAVES
jgi:SAM-dependent methyltransferase